jgi:hypothetical protein
MGGDLRELTDWKRMAKSAATVALFATLLILISMPWDWLSRPLWGWRLLCVLVAVTPHAVILEYIYRKAGVRARSRRARPANN